MMKKARQSQYEQEEHDLALDLLEKGTSVTLGEYNAVLTTIEGEGSEDYITIMVPCNKKWRQETYRKIYEMLNTLKLVCNYVGVKI